MINKICGRAFLCAVLGSVMVFQTNAQMMVAKTQRPDESKSANTAGPENTKRLVDSVLPRYHSQTDGIPIEEIVRRAFENNGDIKIARLQVEKARARVQQAGLRANPTLETEHSSGALVGNSGENSFSAGVSLPLDVYGQRRRRIDLARAEVTLLEAEVVAKERELAVQIFSGYAEALSSLREIEVLEDLLELDTETTRFVQIRVTEGEVAPLELNLLQAEVERLRARRSLAEGKMQAALSKLKFFAGVPQSDALKLREGIDTASLPKLPPSIEIGLDVALRSRPEIKVAELEEELATAGLRLVRSQAKPDVTAYTRYSQGRSLVDDPRGPFAERDRSLTFGVAIGIPIFNRNQGAKAEAEIAIRQAQERRTFSEQLIRNEVAQAFQRWEASRRALTTLQTAVLPRSRENVETIRRVYELGQLKITDLIAEQRRLLDANRDLTETLTEGYRAQADLFVALGLRFEN